MTNISYQSTLLLAILLLTGCTALHTPFSDTIVLERGLESKKKSKGLSTTSSFFNSNIKSYALKNHATEQADGRFAGTNLLSFWLHRTWQYSNSAFGFAVGTGGIGADYSLRISRNLSWTTLINTGAHAETMIQSPVYRKTSSGLSAGLFYRSERYGIRGDCADTDGYVDCFIPPIKNRFRISAIGLRLAHYHDANGFRQRIRFSIGYSPELKGLVFIGGLGGEAL